DATRLTTYTGLDSDPHWSPDGTQIAFVSDRAGGQIDIWVMDADGTDARNLTAGVAGVSADPAWSPEGARIAFANVQGATTGYDVMTVNAADGSGAANLTAALGAGNDGFPAWSPDGSKVAFNRDPLNNSNNEILVVGADGTGAAALTDDPGQATRPSWSGTGIAFVSTRDGNAEIYTMAPDGSAQTRVTTTPAREDAPDWSPDGSRLVFERDGQLITRVLAGGAETLLVATGGSPNWSNASAAAATGLSLTVDRRTAKVGADAVALASLPASSLGLIASGVQASPVGSIPVGSIPVGSIPVGSIPVGSIDLQASPVGSIPVGSIPVGSIPVGSIGLDGVLLSSLGIDLDPILAGSALAGLPRQTLTLDQLLADAVAGPRFRALSLAESGLGESIFGTAGLAPLLLGGLTLQQLPVPPGSSATTWCALFAALGFSCAGAGIDAGTHGLLGAQLASAPVGSIPVGSIPVGSIPVGSIPVGSIPVGSIDLAASPVGSIPVGSIAVEGTPVGSIPVGSIPVGSIPVGSIPVGSIPVGSIDLATSPVGSIPVGSIPVGSIPVGSIPVGSIPVGSIDLATSPVGSIPVGSIANPGDVVSCDVSQSSCTSQTLAQAKANGHLRPGATIAHLGSTVDHITLAEIGAGPLNAAGITLASLTGALGGILLWHLGGSVLDAAGITLASLTGALAGILLGHLEGADFGAITLYQIILDILIRSDFPWESLPIDGMQDFAGFPNNELTYTAAATLKCAAGEDGIVAVRLPAGFRHVAGSAQVTGGGTVIDGPSDPMFSGDGTLKWQVACTGGPLAVALTFRARPGFSVGTFTSDLSASAGAAVSSLEDQAPVLVTEHGEPDSPSTPRTVAADTLVVGHLAGGTDVDVYRFPAPAPGSRVKVFLSHIAEGADFDLAVGTTGTDLLQSSPVGSIPVGSIPMEDEGTTVGASPGGGAETLQDVPLDGIPVDSLSANRDDSDEVAQVLTDGQTEDVLIQVSGYNGSSSPHAYVLRVKVTGPVQLPPCRARSGINPLDDALQVLPAPRADTKAIFLVPRGRLADLHGEAATAAMMGDLATLAARDEVRGQVVPVDADADVRQAYSGWDAQPCSIDAANALVGEIKDVVDQYRSTAGANLRYVVVVGSDESVPFGRVPDLVTLSNEQDATADLGFTLVDGFANALYAAAAHGYILTDDPYAAFSTVPWLGRSLALPQVSVARLVETPEEVSAQIAQYQDAGGLVDPTTSQANVAPPTALTTGYDFLSDGAQQVGAALGRVVGGDASRNVKLINDTWRKHDLTAVYTGADPVPLVASVNGHYNHWQMQPAGPAPGGQFTQTDLFATNEVPTDSLPGRVLFTMGCHGGLNVADRLAPAGAAQARDWAQESARQKAAVYLANTGYGYGDTLASALSERLMALFAEELVDGATTVGEKYVKAKHAYFETMGTYGVFDEKALIEATMYGLPFWRVASAAPLAAGDPSPAVAVDPATGLTTANISIQPLSGTSPEVVAQSDPDRGQWWSARDGRVSFAPYRPLQPLLTRNVTVSGQTARGVFVRRLATTDVGVGDFARARPTIDLGANEPEPLVEGDIYPANVVRLATSRPFGDNSQSLLLVAGQSRSHQGGGPGGIERLVADFGADVAYSDSSDTVAPRIAEVGAVYRSGTGVADFFVEVAAESGASALSRVAVLFKDVDSGGNWELVPLTRVGDTTRWTASRAVASSDLEIFGQAQDGAGNVGYSTNKGRFFTSVLADAAPPEITIQSPAPGDRFEIGDLSAARYSCSDPVGVASCRGPVPPGAGIDTSTPGQHEFLVDAVDAAGNRGQASVFYQVSGSYTFEGFRPPLAPEPTLNLVRAGSTVPVKWQLRDPKGGYVRSLSAVQAIEVWSSSCGTAPVLVLVDVVTDPAAAGLQYDLAGEQYVYHYKVPKRASGCGRLVVRFADGSSAGVGFTYR
ncbi:MAG: PxKF domain-containing protein, partial [Actinobacteria bacterium]|nr:PxKF domain-containing protein [Actinomycetota bacterium]